MTKVIPSLHPSYIQRGSWPELALLRDDLEKALRESAYEEVRRAPTRYITQPTIEQAREVLRLGDRRPLYFDIETDVPPTRIICVGVGRRPCEAICLPWKNQYVALLRAALLDAGSLKVGQNLLAFDIPQLEKHLGIKVAGDVFDTMLAHTTVEPDLPHGLAKIAMSHGWDGLPWKEEMLSDLELYNCRDVDVTARAHVSLATKLDQLRLWPTLNRYQAAMPVVVGMKEWGIGVDLDKQEAVKHVIEEMAAKAEATVKEVVVSLASRRAAADQLKMQADMLDKQAEVLWVPGSKREAGKLRTKAKRLRVDADKLLTPNLSSPLQLKQLLYGELELPTQHDNHSKQVTTNDDALVELLRRCQEGKTKVEQARYERALPVLNALREHREVVANTKYVQNETRIIHPDWMMHTTATGRLSCLRPNMQNIPKRDERWAKLIRPIYKPVVEGNLLTEADYSQIERRLQALYSGDKALLGIFERGGDVHKEMAALCLSVARGSKVTVDDVTPGERHLFKRAVYLEGYGGSWKKLQTVLAGEGVYLTVSQSKEAMTLIKAATPRYNQYREELLEKANKERHLRTPFDRLRWFLGPSFGDALNFPFQSGAADVMLEAMPRVATGLPARCQVVAQVHDALLVEHPPGVGVAKGMMAAMERPVEALGGWRCPVEVKMGSDWGMA